MTDRELDDLLGGATGLTLSFEDGQRVRFSRHELKTPAAHRAAWRRQLGHELPHYGGADHDELMRVLFRVADIDETKENER